MSQSSQVLWFNAVPLLIVGAAYLGASALLGPSLWAARRRASALDLAILLVFPAFGVAALAFGIMLAIEQEPLAGGVWTTFAVAVAAGVPAFVALFWRRARPLLPPASAGRELESVAAISTALGRTDDPAAVARAVLAEVEELVGVEIASLVVVTEDRKTGVGLMGRLRGKELDWFSEVRLDLENEPSGVASAVFEAAPFAVYDAPASKIVSRRLVEAMGAKSLAYVPLIADEQVIAVLVVGSTREHRVFTTEELTLLQTLAVGGGARARPHAHDGRARGGARPRAFRRAHLRTRALGARHRQAAARRRAGDRAPRSESTVVSSASDRKARSRSARSGTRLSLAPIDTGERLAVTNLAARRRETIAIENVAEAPELEDPTLGGREGLLAFDSQAVLAVPIVVFDELIGVMSLHRREPWAVDARRARAGRSCRA